MGDSPFTQMIAGLSINSVWMGAKLLYLVAFFIYGLFALVILTQINQMKKNITMGLEPIILPLALIHLGIAVLAFVLAFMLL